MFRYGLTGADLAEKSGLTTAQISKFRNGGELRTDSLEKLLAAMPNDAQEYMMLLVLQNREADRLPLPKSDRESVQ
jgi:transcriptional regulator with XRE-family HTH domain